MPELDTDGVLAIASLGRQAAGLTPVALLESGGRSPLTLVARPDDVTIEKFETEQYEPHPFTKRGTVTFTDPAGFIEYVNRHRTRATTLWSNRDRGTVTAVIDDHEAYLPDPATPTVFGEAGWAKHVAVLTVSTTLAWRHWYSKNTKGFDQVAFAEHIEDGQANIHDPSPAVFLEVAESLQAHTGVAFKSGQRLDNGQTRIVYEETVSARAGESGNLEIPTKFTLRLAPYEGIAPFLIDAAFRYRLNGPNLTLHYRMDNPERVLELAFEEVLSLISTGHNTSDATSIAAGAPELNAAPRPHIDLPIWAGVGRGGTR